MRARLQVRMDATELGEIRLAAQRQQMTVSGWVRRALRAARRGQPLEDSGLRLEAIRAASRHAFPTGDIDDVLDDIARGRR